MASDLDRWVKKKTRAVGSVRGLWSLVRGSADEEVWGPTTLEPQCHVFCDYLVVMTSIANEFFCVRHIMVLSGPNQL